jgi:hypothetical protein
MDGGEKDKASKSACMLTPSDEIDPHLGLTLLLSCRPLSPASIADRRYNRRDYITDSGHSADHATRGMPLGVARHPPRVDVACPQSATINPDYEIDLVRLPD